MKTAHFANQKNKQIVVGTEWGILSVFQRYKNFLPSLSSDKSGGSIHRARALFSSPDASVVVGLLGGFQHDSPKLGVGTKRRSEKNSRVLAWRSLKSLE